MIFVLFERVKRRIYHFTAAAVLSRPTDCLVCVELQTHRTEKMAAAAATAKTDEKSQALANAKSLEEEDAEKKEDGTRGWSINTGHSTHLHVIRLMNQCRPDVNPAHAMQFATSIGGAGMFMLNRLPPDAAIAKGTVLVRRWCRHCNYGNTNPVRQLWQLLVDCGAVAMYRSQRSDLVLRAVLTGDSVYPQCVLTLPDLTEAELACNNALFPRPTEAAVTLVEAAPGATKAANSRAVEIAAEYDAESPIMKSSLLKDTPLLHAIRSEYLCRGGVEEDPITGVQTPVMSITNRIVSRTKNLNYQNAEGDSALSLAIKHLRPSVVQALLARVPNIDLTIRNTFAPAEPPSESGADTKSGDVKDNKSAEPSTAAPKQKGTGVDDWIRSAREKASSSYESEVDQIADMIEETVIWYRDQMAAATASALLQGDSVALPKVLVKLVNGYIV